MARKSAQYAELYQRYCEKSELASSILSATVRFASDSNSPYHPIGPECRVIHQQPCLFREPNGWLPFQSLAARDRLEDPINDNGPDSGESQYRAYNEVDIIPTLDISPLGRIVVGQLQERHRVWAERGVQVMNRKDHDEDGH